ncbi:MAG: response regulator [Gammaproteobacteria bacterium]
MTSPEILIVEDEEKLATLMADYLHKDGYATHWIDHGDAVIERVTSHPPALILLDLMLPGTDGLTLCRELRAFVQIPIIMVTARVDEIDRLLGLELGADDYVCKPFSPREVVARIRAVLRRAAPDDSATPAAEHGLHIDTERFEATFNDQPLELTPVEFRILALLAAKPGHVYSRNQLMDHIYTDGRVVSDRTVDSHIKNLRHKLDDAGDSEIIRSVYGVGYKLE